jgi:hypothetical protein
MDDVIIVGAGASGLICGIEAARRGLSVCILEKMDKAGKKLYATGNGKCNLGNQRLTLSEYHSVSGSGELKGLSQNIITSSTPEEVMLYFSSIGVPVVSRQGYLYPRSEQAAAVVQALEQSLQLAGGRIQCGETVRRIKKREHSFVVQTEHTSYQAKKVVLATGGAASSKLGSDGSGYRLATDLGHTVTPYAASLCGLHCKESGWNQLQGVRAKGRVSIYMQNKKLAEDTGEIQFTQYGLSGIVIFNLSRYASVAYKTGAVSKQCPVYVSVNLLPDSSVQDMEKEWTRLQSSCGQRSCYDILHGYLPEKLAHYILRLVQIDEKKAWNKLTKPMLHKLVMCCMDMRVVITGVNDLQQAQVTAGGIPLSELRLDTMESKMCPGLYLTGELLDVDADCGGYNLMWAWMSGLRAGRYV